MLIDWFTVCAQAINFLVLVWLLRHFLYKPILGAIDAREKLVAGELADAAAKKADAARERDEFQHRNEQLDQQRAELLNQATVAAKAEGHRLLDEARKAADVLSAKRQNSLRSEARSLNEAVSRRTQEEVFAVARKTLQDLATVSLEERVGEVFTRRLRELDAQAKQELGNALRTAAEPAVVRSAFELPPVQRAAIQNALNETFSADIHLRYEVAPDIVSGIELTANGRKLAWSIAGYLAFMTEHVDALLKEHEKVEVKAEPKAETQPAHEEEAAHEGEVDHEPRTAGKTAPEQSAPAAHS